MLTHAALCERAAVPYNELAIYAARGCQRQVAAEAS